MSAAVNLPSVEERLRAIRHHAIVIEAVLHVAEESEGAVLDSCEYVGIALDQCRELYDELHWLAQLPAVILNTDAPAFDQAKATTAGAR